MSYGTTNHNGNRPGPENGGTESVPKQTFSISEPYQTHGDTTYLRGHGKKSGFCCRGEADGLRVIVLSMFVFAIGVTVALMVQIAAGISHEPQDTDHAVSDHPVCTRIGEQVLEMGGNAVDSVVAGSICLAVAAPHLTGLGGGGVMMIHRHRDSNNTKVIDFREMTPINARNDRYLSNPLLATTGLTSIGIPGFLKGLEYAHQNYGAGVRNSRCCTWSDLVYLTIREMPNLTVSQHFDNATQSRLGAAQLDNYPSLKSFLKGKSITEGSRMSDLPGFSNLMNTLKAVASEGAAALYTGSLANRTVQALHGYLTLEDLGNYTVVEREAIATQIGDFQILATPSPTSGPQTLAFVNAMEEYNRRYGSHGIDMNFLNNITMVLQRTEMFQLGLGDPSGYEDHLVENRSDWLTDKANVHKFLNSVEGSNVGFESLYPISEAVGANMVAMDRMDNYVSVVTSLNTWFGSKIMTADGIIFNNALANFAIHEENTPELKTANQMSVFKRPLTSNVLALVVNSKRICGSRFVLGGSTPDAVGGVVADVTVFGSDLSTALNEGRILVSGNQILMENAFEGFDDKIVETFHRGDNVSFVELPFTTVNGIEKYLDNVLPSHDIRGYPEPLPV
ncbi:hypothetical protein TCAL_07601 [Tigriopus californicus]|uniref:Gamma-glutamyltransferase n=1 Tax=Tigriopus californicus TaxID=6832 RepID=A0A553PGF6_TIGCA|nr:glutathione hydrolase 7-like [Tigriopus californicus]TRY76762.1 hypothetical protein TCAL_07601 [Tigriopus californicus]